MRALLANGLPGLGGRASRGFFGCEFGCACLVWKVERVVARECLKNELKMKETDNAERSYTDKLQVTTFVQIFLRTPITLSLIFGSLFVAFLTSPPAAVTATCMPQQIARIFFIFF